jgi:hypothetical protein
MNPIIRNILMFFYSLLKTLDKLLWEQKTNKMNKREILQNLKLREQEKEAKFMEFMKTEGFTQTIDKTNNFQTNMPLFYRKVSENQFLVFNIPFFNKVKEAHFEIDFWKITAKSEEEFLTFKVLDENLITLLLGFEMEKHLGLYKKIISEINL